MNGSNWYLLQQLLNWLEQGIEPWLATVLETYGSSPRPVGSMMLYHPSKGIVGSLSGGCIEQELVEQLAHAEPACPQVIRYGGNAEEQQRLQLPCGGHLDVLLEKISVENSGHFSQLFQTLKQRHHTGREIHLHNGELAIIDDQSLPTDIQRDEQVIRHALRPHDKLLMVGAGEVARCVADIAKNLGFEITLCDFRDEFLQGWQVDGVHVVRGMPDDLIAESFNDPHCAIIALAHDPRIDDMAMLEALNSQAFYVGAMGSLKTSAKRRERLSELGITPEALAQLHAPIGLDIGSKTPYEIALSIVAHIIQHRYQ
ncbi:XdhC family protein [Bacterioplanoides sp.]|uniref:XdhC family protein n=1 Tax=Bacterioplanoides sp. TaxID=2066072 RepID=UPI003B0080CA